MTQQCHFWDLSKEAWNNSKDYEHPYVHCSIICNLQDLEAARVHQ